MVIAETLNGRVERLVRWNRFAGTHQNEALKKSLQERGTTKAPKITPPKKFCCKKATLQICVEPSAQITRNKLRLELKPT
jgi:hypothetical protein